VWLEGRSAAWRYPSEIEELKAFSPVVEEQPFDRFYKKAEAKTFEPAIKDNTRIKETPFIKDEPKVAAPVIQQEQMSIIKEAVPETINKFLQSEVPQVKPISNKKIHVSLPGNKYSDPVISTQPKENKTLVTPISIPVEVASPIPQPVATEKTINKKLNSEKKNEDLSTNVLDSSRKIKAKESTVAISPVKDAPVSKLLFRTVAAACLLLGGALIGLIINYNNQQKKFQQLNQLVQEIKQQDNPGSAKTVKNESIAKDVPVTIAETEPVVPVAQEPVYKEEIKLPVAKKDRPSKPLDKGSRKLPVVSPITETGSKDEEANQNKPVANTDKIPSELAKKNLSQLVSVNHHTYKTGVFGGISNLSLNLTNKSLFQLEKVEVEVIYLSPEKKVVNKQNIVFENVSPGGQLNINVPKSNRGVSFEYSIKKISTKEFGLAGSDK
ncbi:MAG: hypothetical protein ACXWCG_13350, partial [Flavitalea sp.]